MAYVTVGEENGAPIELHYTDHGAGTPVVLIHGWPLSGRVGEAGARTDRGRPSRHHVRPPRLRRVLQPFTGYDYDTLAPTSTSCYTRPARRDAGRLLDGRRRGRPLSRHATAPRASRRRLRRRRNALFRQGQRNPAGLDLAAFAQFRAGVRNDRLAFLDGLFENFYGLGERAATSATRWSASPGHRRGASPRHARLWASWACTDFRADLAKIDVPTLVVHGDADRSYRSRPAASARTSRAGQPAGADRGRPHGFNTTHAEQFNAALVAFLAQKERAAA